MKDWIGPNEASLIPDASDDALKNVLLTCDGPGREIKALALAELKTRWLERQRSLEASFHLDASSSL